MCASSTNQEDRVQECGRDFTEQGRNLQVLVALYAACTLLVSCSRGFAVLQPKHRVEGQIGTLHDDKR